MSMLVTPQPGSVSPSGAIAQVTAPSLTLTQQQVSAAVAARSLQPLPGLTSAATSASAPGVSALLRGSQGFVPAVAKVQPALTGALKQLDEALPPAPSVQKALALMSPAQKTVVANTALLLLRQHQNGQLNHAELRWALQQLLQRGPGIAVQPSTPAGAVGATTQPKVPPQMRPNLQPIPSQRQIAIQPQRPLEPAGLPTIKQARTELPTEVQKELDALKIDPSRKMQFWDPNDPEQTLMQNIVHASAEDLEALLGEVAEHAPQFYRWLMRQPWLVEALADRIASFSPGQQHALAQTLKRIDALLAAQNNTPSKPVAIAPRDREGGSNSEKPTTSEPLRSPTLIVQPDVNVEFKAQSTDGKTLIVLPDTHGRDDLQQKAFDYLRQRQAWVFDGFTTVIGLGDFIDKGGNSAQNVEAFIDRKNELGVDEVLLHIGNHELWLTEWLDHPDKLKYAYDWIANRGGAIALQSYDRFAKANPELSNFSLDGIDLKRMPVKEVVAAGGGTRIEPDNSSGFYTRLYERVIQGLPRKHLEFFSSLRRSTRIGDYFFSHAGADPNVRLDEQGLGALTWIRHPYLRHEGNWLYEPNTVVVSGHTVLKRPLIQPNKFAIDLGSHMTNDFMVAVLKNDLVRFAIFRDGEDPSWTDLRAGFDDRTFSPVFDPDDVMKNKPN